jgi:hypothetical protein
LGHNLGVPDFSFGILTPPVIGWVEHLSSLLHFWRSAATMTDDVHVHPVNLICPLDVHYSESSETRPSLDILWPQLGSWGFS